jgi:hypothetical protein
MRSFLPSDLLPISAAISLLEYAPDDSAALTAVWNIFAEDARPSTFERLFEYVRKLSDEKVSRDVSRSDSERPLSNIGPWGPLVQLAR